MAASSLPQPQVFDLLLVHLLKNRTRWPAGTTLSHSFGAAGSCRLLTLDSRINAARNAIGDNGKAQKLIKTIPRKGGALLRWCRERASGQPSTRCRSARSKTAAAAALLLLDRPADAAVQQHGERRSEQDYFSDGISEDIITALSKLRWFFVDARNSSFIYKGKSAHMNQVAADLGCRVVEGSALKERRSGPHYRAAQ